MTSICCFQVAHNNPHVRQPCPKDSCPWRLCGRPIDGNGSWGDPLHQAPGGTCCPGVSYTAPDGCNTCICPASGLMSDGVFWGCGLLPLIEQDSGVRLSLPWVYPVGNAQIWFPMVSPGWLQGVSPSGLLKVCWSQVSVPRMMCFDGP